MATALVTHPDALLHQTPARVFDQVGRLDFILRALEDLPLDRHEAPLATLSQIETLHDPAYVAHVMNSIPKAGFVALDADTDDETCLSPTSRNAILRAAGGAMRGVDLVMTGAASTAFVAMRPPGHHALQDRAMGFCFFANAALAARHALDAHGLSRVAIVDFDVHHGNGSQALFEDDHRVLVATSQQLPLWPGTGDAADSGSLGNILNIPLAPATGGAEMRKAFTETLFPRLRAFAPELIVISAGFDAHRDDPLGELLWEEQDFDWITRHLCGIARDCAQGRVVSVLEGGYDLAALARSARAHVAALLRSDGM